MVSGSVTAHQLHRCPVFLAFLRIERQPRQPLQLARQIRKLAERDLAVIGAHCGARAAATAVAEQGNISPGLKAANVAMGCKHSKFVEEVSVAARAKRGPGSVLVLFGY